MKRIKSVLKRFNSSPNFALYSLFGVILLALSLPLFLSSFVGKSEESTRAAGTNYQPSAPYYATFFYPWYQAPSTDGLWSDWNDNAHTPPTNWFSNYLPDPNPSAFDPTTELYSSNDDKIIYWQLRKLAEAKQTVAISSWWGIGHKTDTAFKHIITDVMNRADNPYPNLRWAIMYEKEGFANPPVTEIVNDLNYIKTNYGNQPGMLKINGKPVVFVYNAAHTGSSPAEDLSRWQQVRAQTGFYVVMKVDPLNAGANPSLMDSWYEYAPAAGHYLQKLNYFSMVSPGFWLNGSAERLTRDSAAFETAVKQMVASSSLWKLTETWNEWGEGTSVEPGDQVNQTTTGQATLKTNGYPFKNLYVDILNRNLPAISTGVGGNPSGSPVVGQTNVIVAAGDIACPASAAVTAKACQQKATSDLVLSIKPLNALILGDDQYDAGKLSDYMGSYDPTWGRFKNISLPSIGNHQYGDPNVQGYFDYWIGANNQQGALGKRGEGWYSTDIGNWHVIALDSQCGKVPQSEQLGGQMIPEPNNCDIGGAQEIWLKADLQAHQNVCTLAFWHEPYFTSGSRGNMKNGNGAQTYPLLVDLYNAHADVILNGHEHWYERFAKQDPSGTADPTKGIREFTVGTGGKETLNLGTPGPFPNRETRDTTSFGVLKMTLGPNNYSWQFVPVPGYAYTDSGSANCNTKPTVQPTNTLVPVASPTSVVPTFYCGGSGNCVPSSSPTPSVFVTPNPSVTGSDLLTPTSMPTVTLSDVPTAIVPTSDVTIGPTDSVPTTVPIGGGKVPGNFLQLLLQFIFQLLQLLFGSMLRR